MNKNDLIQLTNRVYALTLLFPKKEPLRWKLRERADDILAGWARIDSDQLLVDDLTAIDCFFEVTRAQKWVKEAELLSIQLEYANLRGQNCSLANDLLCLQQEVIEPSIEPIILFPEAFAQEEPTPTIDEPSLSDIMAQEPLPALEPEVEAEAEAELVDAEPVAEEKEPSRNGLSPRHEKILGIIKERERVQVGEVKQVFPAVDKRTLRRDFRSLLEQGFIERLGQKNDTFYRLKVS
ncbi:MAG: DeoR family transcriptional regulator [Patescibacteria group bacterium]